MGWEQFTFEDALRKARQNVYDQADQFKDPINTNLAKDKMPKVIDCGELIEVNGVYVPTE
ncbi:hypothetical protein [Paenibacillus agaridevorans]|uniref:hypothetical protein n=1 Tax=Paenibacillus agaridevorans TaxID=171404 RepID=UPI001BE44096|nr:hypothetical protein [Paenibacillus agaridevorans]